MNGDLHDTKDRGIRAPRFSRTLTFQVFKGIQVQVMKTDVLTIAALIFIAGLVLSSVNFAEIFGSVGLSGKLSNNPSSALSSTEVTMSLNQVNANHN